MAIKLSQLECFVAMAETGSMSDAARRIGLSQPSLSRQLRLLEESLGLTLCKRGARGVELTSDGLRLQGALEPLLLQFHNLLEGATGERLEGTLAIGALEGVGHAVLMGEILAFRRDCPGVRFHVEYLKEREIAARLREGSLDFGLVTAQGADFAALPLFPERAVMVTREANRLAFADALARGRAEVVAYRQDDSLLAAFLKLHHPEAPKPGGERLPVIVSVTSHRSMIDALVASDAYAVMPWSPIARAVETRMLRLASPHELAGEIFLAYPRGRPVRRRHRAFREHLAKLSRAPERP